MKTNRLQSIIDRCIRFALGQYTGQFSCKEVEILLKAGVKPVDSTKKVLKEKIKLFRTMPDRQGYYKNESTYGQFYFYPNGVCMDRTKSIHWCWKIFVLLEGENKKRLITPHTDLMVYETPINFVFDSPEEAEAWLEEAVKEISFITKEEAEEFVLTRISMKSY